jgi:hypothetical protein
MDIMICVKFSLSLSRISAPECLLTLLLVLNANANVQSAAFLSQHA